MSEITELAAPQRFCAAQDVIRENGQYVLGCSYEGLPCRRVCQYGENVRYCERSAEAQETEEFLDVLYAQFMAPKELER